MSKTNSFKITIIDNNNGTVLCDEDNVSAIVGAFSTEEDTRSIGFTRCNPVTLAQAIGGAQKVIAEIVEEHPELNFIAQMIAQMEEAGIGEDGDDE